MQANFVISLGNKSQVPIVSFSATSPSLTSLQSPYFFRAAQSDLSQVKAISSIVQAFGWPEAVPIYVDNQFGETLIPFLTAALQEHNTRVPYLSLIPESATDDRIAKELYKLMNMETRVFIVHAASTLGLRILAKAEEIGMMSEGYAWIMTDSMTTFALAMAVEKVGTANLSFNEPNISSRGVLTGLETLGVSGNGPRLIQELSNITFEGLSGDFHFVNGELEASVFEIVNINGNGERRVGFWTPQSGLVFPKGSPLVADISRGILNVTQGDEMERIQNKWFKGDGTCPDVSPVVSSNTLGLESFWGLFLIAGVASISALVVFAAMFLYEQRHVLLQFPPETSMRMKVGIMSRIFDQKDLSCHTFKNDELREASSHYSVHSKSVEGSSWSTNCSPSSTISQNQTDSPDITPSSVEVC
ncbi:hypothetical protein V6N12_048009 [Hibiscus sabdariffa]|uniref:Receptor ligand binding region domain-containing protein n=1 Tax=Hibiscus sabdariffa TaxID=183260 RepID=A0ABR2CUL3_9ROSI